MGLRFHFAENLRAQGSGLSARQAEESPHVPEKSAPPPIAEKKEAVTLSPKKLGGSSHQGQVRIGMQEAEKVQLYTLEEKRRLNEGDYLAKLHDNSLLSNLLEAFAVLERRFNLWDRDEAGMLLFTAVPLP